MNEAVFISDLHLHPLRDDITGRFYQFCDWAPQHTKAVYILGDFFHAWAGDDGLDAWSLSICKALANLAAEGVAVYLMHGNRDFLLGKEFASRARLKLLQEPTLITLGNKRVLLSHGDSYCTQDKSHQWFRRLTRNVLFSKLFLSCPYSFRQNLVHKMRNHSQTNRQKSPAQMSTVPQAVMNHMKANRAATVIHGHIHKPGYTLLSKDNRSYHQYVLSDWDDMPTILCYHGSNGFNFNLFSGEKNAY